MSLRRDCLAFCWVGLPLHDEALGPEVPAGDGIDQLGVDPYFIAGTAHAALQHIAHAQKLAVECQCVLITTLHQALACSMSRGDLPYHYHCVVVLMSCWLGTPEN